MHLTALIFGAYLTKEALQRKKAVKEKTASPKEFTDWLYQQSNILVELCEIVIE